MEREEEKSKKVVKALHKILRTFMLRRVKRTSRPLMVSLEREGTTCLMNMVMQL